MKRVDPSPLRKRKPRPPPIRSRAALEGFLERGGRICKTLPRTECEPVIYTDPDTDRTISWSLVDWAFANGKLRGLGDGLFGEHQTFERAA